MGTRKGDLSDKYSPNVKRPSRAVPLIDDSGDRVLLNLLEVQRLWLLSARRVYRAVERGELVRHRRPGRQAYYSAADVERLFGPPKAYGAAPAPVAAGERERPEPAQEVLQGALKPLLELVERRSGQADPELVQAVEAVKRALADSEGTIKANYPHSPAAA